jgi:hypothetical protein
MNVDSLPQSSYRSSPTKYQDSTLMGLHHRHHIPGAVELPVAGHFFLTVVPFFYPELIPDVPESVAIELRRRLPDAYTSELPPYFLPRRCATHRAASHRRRTRVLPAPRMNALGALAATARPLGSAPVLCALAAGLLCCWAAC